ncbi:hypothetical protein C5L29_000611 [Lactiplantibacillus pentosus]|nr:hypothetical protein C5L29_000611 [Lactiplantibacillus pentosus]
MLPLLILLVEFILLIYVIKIQKKNYELYQIRRAIFLGTFSKKERLPSQNEAAQEKSSSNVS